MYLLPALSLFLILHTSYFLLLLFYLPLFHTVYLSFLTPQFCIFSFSYLPLPKRLLYLSFLSPNFYLCFFPLSLFFFLYTSIFLLLHLLTSLPHRLPHVHFFFGLFNFFSLYFPPYIYVSLLLYLSPLLPHCSSLFPYFIYFCFLSFFCISFPPYIYLSFALFINFLSLCLSFSLFFHFSVL
jgi:hypothetical protein